MLFHAYILCLPSHYYSSLEGQTIRHLKDGPNLASNLELFHALKYVTGHVSNEIIGPLALL